MSVNVSVRKGMCKKKYVAFNLVFSYLSEARASQVSYYYRPGANCQMAGHGAKQACV